MDTEQSDLKREKVLNKLAKIKALADRGVGGEKETALRMYEELKRKYDISPDEAEAALNKLEKRWFSYKTELEEQLLLQIFYKVTGDVEHYEYTGSCSRRKKRCVMCTELEAAEIQLLFNFYRERMKEELEVFMLAFKQRNDLCPDETARAYKKHKGRSIDELTEEELRKCRKAAFMAGFMDKKEPPRAAIEDRSER